MAFNINAQIILSQPKNLNNIANQITKQLGKATKLNINIGNAKQLTTLSKQLTTLNNSFTKLNSMQLFSSMPFETKAYTVIVIHFGTLHKRINDTLFLIDLCT